MPHDAQRPVLVTGASGFIGYHLASRLSARYPVVAGTYLTRPVSHPRVDMVPVDLSDERAVSRLVRDMNPWAVVHCAAMTNQVACAENPDEAEAAIVFATTALCEAVRRWSPGARVIYLSTDLVFDGEGAPYAEDDLAKPLGLYGSLKLVAEMPARRLGNGAVLRPALTYGPALPHATSFLGWMVDRLARGEPLHLYQDEWRTPVFVEDACAAVELLLEAPTERIAGKVFHAGGAERLSRVEMGAAVAAAFGLDPASIVPRERNGDPAARQRARDVSLSCGRLHALGWKQTSFADGLAASRASWNPGASS